MKYIVLIFTLSAVQIAFGARNENVNLVQRPANAVFEDSSEHHRVDKTYQVTLQLLGLNPSGSGGGGLSAGYFLDRNSMIVLEATGSGVGIRSYSSSYDIQTSTVGVHYKRFFANSFYVRGGVDQRHVDYKYEYKGTFSSTFDSKTSFIGDSTAASLVIGNQWQWENFTLGCDWIGLTAPFLTKISNEEYSVNADQFDRNRQESDKDYFVNHTIGQALRFYLGASF